MCGSAGNSRGGEHTQTFWRHAVNREPINPLCLITKLVSLIEISCFSETHASFLPIWPREPSLPPSPPSALFFPFFSRIPARAFYYKTLKARGPSRGQRYLLPPARERSVLCRFFVRRRLVCPPPPSSPPCRDPDTIYASRSVAAYDPFHRRLIASSRPALAFFSRTGGLLAGD